MNTFELYTRRNKKFQKKTQKFSSTFHKVEVELLRSHFNNENIKKEEMKTSLQKINKHVFIPIYL